MQPENALDSWRQWAGELRTRPVILGPLSGGRNNRSFLLDAAGSRMVLRLNGMDSLLPDTTRSYEAGIWQAASQQGIAPPLLHVDEQHKYLVSAYIDNSLPPLSKPDAAYIKRAIELLQRCHQLQAEAPMIDYRSHIEKYWQVIENKDRPVNETLSEQREPMQKLAEKLINSKPATGLCHHDPIVANFVGNSDRLYLIDWEYAAHGLPIMDYAALAIEWKTEDSTILEHTEFKSDSLINAKALYGYLCSLWEEATT